MTWFKALDGTQSTHGGNYRYPGIGRWTRHIDQPLEACAVGYHLAKDGQILDWLAPTIYVAEPCPDHPPVDADGKWVTCRVRLLEKTPWGDRTARLFAADMAEAALLGERAAGREPDPRSWAAITAARQYTNGEIGDAAWDAAGDAAWAAAWDAARAAARAAAWAAARAVARDVARDVARAAARDAAWDAARAAARARLTAYLLNQPIPPVVALY